METVKKINQLLDQAQEIEIAASGIQGHNSTSEAEIAMLRESYMVWYAEGLPLLSGSLRDQFLRQYEGAQYSAKIKQFLANPTELDMNYKNAPGWGKIFLDQWRYPYEKTFYRPFMEQLLLLRQARKCIIGPLSLVSEQLKRTIATICKESFQLSSIDTLFLSNDCEPKWWHQPKKDKGSSRMNQVYGWFEAMLIYVPEQEAQITQDVIGDILSYGHIPTSYRKRLQVELDQLIQRVQQVDTQKKKEPQVLVDIDRIRELREINSQDFDLTKLIQLCEELNECYISECYFAVAMLTRAILDHVPPIFGIRNFPEVANNYSSGSKSFKQHMQHLDVSLRKIADSFLHQQIRSKEVLPNKTQINFSNDIDVLLGEIVRVLK